MDTQRIGGSRATLGRGGSHAPGMSNDDFSVLSPRQVHDFRNAQTRWQRAVCLVNSPGRFARTGTLLMVNGSCAVLVGGGDHDGKRCMSMVDADHASADFYCDGSAEPTAKARLLPRALWREIPEHGLVVVGVDGEPLRGPRIWPLVPSPEVMSGLAATMGEVGAGPTLTTYSHVHGVTKTEHVLHLDEYDVRSDRLFLRDPAPVQCHGSPVFYAGQWVGVVTEEVEELPRNQRAKLGIAPLYLHSAERCVGVGSLLLGFGVVGINFHEWPIPADVDADEDAEELDDEAGGDDRAPSRSRQICGDVRLDTPFERPRLPAIEFVGRSGRAAHDAQPKAGVGHGGTLLVDGGGPADANRGRHYVPALALKAVHESNVEVLARLKERYGPDFLRDLRVAAGWTLAHVAATVNGGAMLLPLATLGVALETATPKGDTVAHVAAYHGNVGALRVLRARGVTINAENSRGERPVHKAQLRRHDAAVEWFKRRRVRLPKADFDENRHLGFAPDAPSVPGRNAAGPRPDMDPESFLEGFFDDAGSYDSHSSHSTDIRLSRASGRRQKGPFSPNAAHAARSLEFSPGHARRGVHLAAAHADAPDAAPLRGEMARTRAQITTL